MRAIRITQSNWLNDQVGGDQNTVKLVDDDMAREAVEVHGIAVYAPEHDPVQFVGTEAAAKRLEELKVTVTDFEPAPGVDSRLANSPEREPAEFGQDPRYVEEDLAASRPGPVELPRSVDNKAAWVRWAVYGDHGQAAVTEEQASAMPKLQLQHRYGGRL